MSNSVLASDQEMPRRRRLTASSFRELTARLRGERYVPAAEDWTPEPANGHDRGEDTANGHANGANRHADRPHGEIAVDQAVEPSTASDDAHFDTDEPEEPAFAGPDADLAETAAALDEPAEREAPAADDGHEAVAAAVAAEPLPQDADDPAETAGPEAEDAVAEAAYDVVALPADPALEAEECDDWQHEEPDPEPVETASFDGPETVIAMGEGPADPVQAEAEVDASDQDAGPADAGTDADSATKAHLQDDSDEDVADIRAEERVAVAAETAIETETPAAEVLTEDDSPAVALAEHEPAPDALDEQPDAAAQPEPAAEVEPGDDDPAAALAEHEPEPDALDDQPDGEPEPEPAGEAPGAGALEAAAQLVTPEPDDIDDAPAIDAGPATIPAGPDPLQPEDLSMPVANADSAEPATTASEPDSEPDGVPEMPLDTADSAALNDIIGTLAAKFTNSPVLRARETEADEFGQMDFDSDHGTDRFAAGNAAEAAPVAIDPQSAETAKMLLDIMSMPSGAAQPQERALAADTLLRLVDRMPASALVALAERLCIMETPPVLLVNKLIAHQNSEVAGPLLERCTLISDQDLMRLIRNSNNVKRRIIARRRSLSSALCDALIANGDASVFLTVVRNPGAAVSYEAFIRLVDRASSQPTLQAPLATRADTPAPIAFELFWILPSELRRYVLSRFLTDSTTLDKILKIARTVDAEASEDEPDSAQFADKADIAKFVTLVEDGQTMEAARLLGAMAGICEANAVRVISDPEGEPMSVACKAIGVSRAEFSDAITRWESSSNAMLRADKNTTELKNLFESLSFNKARTLLTYWDWAAQKSGPYARKVA